MKRKFALAGCAAMVPADGSVRAWKRCAEIALCSDLFCAMHRDELDGALLGLLAVQEYARHAKKRLKKQGGKKA